ncbi:MAG: ribosomal-protein-alanine N-acetyltransferase [Dehalococcoidia bacterium]|nr:ribosomal-protein-alanine N-acetyltransferase [Dehalococcoidia bacterium]
MMTTNVGSGTYMLAPMHADDIPEVVEIERESFAVMWPSGSYQQEMRSNRMARYLVLRYRPTPGEVVPPLPVRPPARRSFPFSLFPWLSPTTPEPDPSRPPVIGYAGLWLMVDEAHITTVAVRQTFRGRGLGKVLMLAMMDLARNLGARMVTLEVRESNAVAIKMYDDLGFQQKGVRPRYYTDNGEDAIIMWSEELFARSARQRLDDANQALLERVSWETVGTRR